MTIRESGGVVQIDVIENPVINSVNYEGNDRLDEKGARQAQPAAPDPHPRQGPVRRSAHARTLSPFGPLRCDHRAEDHQSCQNRVDLVCEIDEGPSTGILDISFIGNKIFTERELRSEIVTTNPVVEVFASQDNYDPDRVTFDREQLRRFYLRNSYADFRVISAVAELAHKSGFSSASRSRKASSTISAK